MENVLLKFYYLNNLVRKSECLIIKRGKMALDEPRYMILTMIFLINWRSIHKASLFAASSCALFLSNLEQADKSIMIQNNKCSSAYFKNCWYNSSTNNTVKEKRKDLRFSGKIFTLIEC